MRSNINYRPGKAGYPTLPRRGESIRVRRDGTNLSCICKVKIVCASIGSQGIPSKRDIPARWEHIYKP